jgi:hypothetical protein
MVQFTPFSFQVQKKIGQKRYFLVSFHFLWRREKREERRPERRGEKREKEKKKKNELKDMFILSFNGKSMRWVTATNRVNHRWVKC